MGEEGDAFSEHVLLLTSPHAERRRIIWVVYDLWVGEGKNTHPENGKQNAIQNCVRPLERLHAGKKEPATPPKDWRQNLGYVASHCYLTPRERELILITLASTQK